MVEGDGLKYILQLTIYQLRRYLIIALKSKEQIHPLTFANANDMFTLISLDLAVIDQYAIGECPSLYIAITYICKIEM